MDDYLYLRAYGLDIIITEQDDPVLWEAVLSCHWPAPGDSSCMVEALRFDTGRQLQDGEQPQGEENEQYAKMRAMVDIEEWCFERVGEAQLQVKVCPKPVESGGTFFQGMGLMAVLSGQADFTPPAQVVFIYLGISRPSKGTDQVVVYTASSAPGLGDGAAYRWRRKASGAWEPSDQCLARWIT